MPPKRRLSDPTPTTPRKPAAKKIKSDGRASNLIPVDPRKLAIQGAKNESLLHMLCKNEKTGEEKEQHFKKIVYAKIDWNDKEHIKKINSWRNQLYNRAGMKIKEVKAWAEDEELWIELYYHMMIVEGLKHGLMTTKATCVWETFNKFFAGKVLLDKHGAELEPHNGRELNAFQSKFNRIFKPLKDRLDAVSYGKSGDVFVPKITDHNLAQFKELKAELKDQGIYAESANSENIAQWLHFFSSIPESAGEDIMVDSDDSELSDMNDEELENIIEPVIKEAARIVPDDEMSASPEELPIDGSDSLIRIASSYDDPTRDADLFSSSYLTANYDGPTFIEDDLSE